jgi:hypothetical protein
MSHFLVPNFVLYSSIQYLEFLTLYKILYIRYKNTTCCRKKPFIKIKKLQTNRTNRFESHNILFFTTQFLRFCKSTVRFAFIIACKARKQSLYIENAGGDPNSFVQITTGIQVFWIISLHSFANAKIIVSNNRFIRSHSSGKNTFSPFSIALHNV